jgi:TRAP-type C4-dicarboxylate transport system permease small subunit
LRIVITVFVVFTCYLLFKGGMFVSKSAGAHYEVFNPKKALLVLPIGAALIAVHYILHALTDALYLSAGLIPPEEEGPAGH